jgi:hypothetical protein
MQAWLVDDPTKVSAAVGSPGVPRLTSSWVSNATVAQELRVLAGMCATVSLDLAREILGPDARATVDEVSTCRYSNGSATRDLWISNSRFASAGVAREMLGRARRDGGRSLNGLGDDAYFLVEPERKCSTVGSARLNRTFYVSLCGDGFGIDADSAQLRSLSRRVLGM